MTQETWYVLEDDSAGDPRDVKRDDKGVLRHKNGKAVALGKYGPRSRGVDPDEMVKTKPVKADPPKAADDGKKTADMKARPEPDPAAKPGYVTRDDAKAK